MAADKQYAGAFAAIKYLEQNFLPDGQFTTYGAVCEALHYKPSQHARNVGQVCSVIDAAWFWAKLPFLSLEKVRNDDGQYNPDSFAGDWESIKATLIENSSRHAWSATDIGSIGAKLTHMNGEGAIAQWTQIVAFGQKGRDRALTHI